MHRHEDTIAYLRQRLGYDAAFAIKYLIKIYERQMDNVGRAQDVNGHSGWGFTLRDRDFLSTLADDYQGKDKLSDRQIERLLKAMPKYAGQVLLLIEKPKALANAVAKWMQAGCKAQQVQTKQPLTPTVMPPSQPASTAPTTMSGKRAEAPVDDEVLVEGDWQEELEE